MTETFILTTFWGDREAETVFLRHLDALEAFDADLDNGAVAVSLIYPNGAERVGGDMGMVAP